MVLSRDVVVVNFSRDSPDVALLQKSWQNLATDWELTSALPHLTNPPHLIHTTSHTTTMRVTQILRGGGAKVPYVLTLMSCSGPLNS